jgi:hypothetical protein
MSRTNLQDVPVRELLGRFYNGKFYIDSSNEILHS